MIVVSDTSSVTNLWQIQQLDLLERLFQEVIIPPAVEAELFRIPSQQQDLKQLTWLKTKTPTDLSSVQRLLTQLDAGESEAITLASELQADYLLIDEMMGRSLAQQKGLKVTGVLGVLLMAKQQQLITAVKPLMDALQQQARFFIHQRLYDEVLKLTGEE